MSRDTDRHFREAEAAIERAFNAFMSAIDRIEERADRDGVSFHLVEEVMLLKLCKELTKRLDPLRTNIPPAMLKLSNARTDYRDSRWEERE